MSSEPYYFELVIRNLITRKDQKNHGVCKFFIHKNSQRVDMSKIPFDAIFKQRCMRFENQRLNFFLPNYFPGKSSTSIFNLSLTQITNPEGKPTATQKATYILDSSIYIQQFKTNGKNYFSEIWDMSKDYSVEVQLFFEQSKYALEKLLSEYRGKPATTFIKPLAAKIIGGTKKFQVEDDRDSDDQQKYDEKRNKLFSKYTGALVGHGGYRIFDEDNEKIVKKQSQPKKSINKLDATRNEPISTPSKTKIVQSSKKQQTQKSQLAKEQTSKTPKNQDIDALQDLNPQAEMKNIKFLIIGIVILILLGSGYFLSKLFLKDQQQSIQVPKSSKQPQQQISAPKKSKTKGSKKNRNSIQL